MKRIVCFHSLDSLDSDVASGVTTHRLYGPGDDGDEPQGGGGGVSDDGDGDGGGGEEPGCAAP